MKTSNSLFRICIFLRENCETDVLMQSSPPKKMRFDPNYVIEGILMLSVHCNIFFQKYKFTSRAHLELDEECCGVLPIWFLYKFILCNGLINIFLMQEIIKSVFFIYFLLHKKMLNFSVNL